MRGCVLITPQNLWKFDFFLLCKLCWVIRTQTISVLKLFLLYLSTYEVSKLEPGVITAPGVVALRRSWTSYSRESPGPGPPGAVPEALSLGVCGCRPTSPASPPPPRSPPPRGSVATPPPPPPPWLWWPKTLELKPHDVRHSDALLTK